MEPTTQPTNTNPESNNNTKTIVSIIVLVIIVAAVVAFAYMKGGFSSRNDATVCTEDVQLCPDGSYVSRVAPSCDFASCTPVSTGSSTLQGEFDVKG